MTAKQRDPKGRFLQGHANLSPGRPPVAREIDYLQTLQRCCTLDDWRDIVLRAVASAKQGSDKARSWLGNYLMPKQEQPILVHDPGRNEAFREASAELRNDGRYLEWLREQALEEDNAIKPTPDGNGKGQ